jgi:hypothetical protein
MAEEAKVFSAMGVEILVSPKAAQIVKFESQKEMLEYMGVVVSETPPENPLVKDLWIDIS